jgi:phage gp37-like protein
MKKVTKFINIIINRITNYKNYSIMTKTISFNELRRIKDSLPDGSMHKIADRLNVNVQTVRNYFGGANYAFGKNCGLHIEPGPDGGIVVLDDTLIYDMALEILKEQGE